MRKTFCQILQSTILVFSLFFLTACSNSEVKQDYGSSTVVVDYSIETNGEFIPIVSDNVSMASYDLETKIMIVQFDNGQTYWYKPVSQNVWTNFYNAQPNPWSQVGYPELVKSGIPYGRIN
jgi:hypothetical protein